MTFFCYSSRKPPQTHPKRQTFCLRRKEKRICFLSTQLPKSPPPPPPPPRSVPPSHVLPPPTTSSPPYCFPAPSLTLFKLIPFLFPPSSSQYIPLLLPPFQTCFFSSPYFLSPLIHFSPIFLSSSNIHVTDQDRNHCVF